VKKGWFPKQMAVSTDFCLVIFSCSGSMDKETCFPEKPGKPNHRMVVLDIFGWFMWSTSTIWA